jgi:hypothetical protein
MTPDKLSNPNPGREAISFGRRPKDIFSPFDFVRIIRSAVPSVPGWGQRPFLTPAQELEGKSFAELGLGNLVQGLNSVFCSLLGSPWLKAPTPLTTISDYAGQLLGTVSASGTLLFNSQDAFGRFRVTPHTLTMLEEEAKAASFLFMGAKRVLSAVPLVNPFGMVFGLILPRLLGVPALDVPPAPTLAGTALQKGDLIVLFPQLLARLDIDAPPELTVATSSSPPLGDGAFRSLMGSGAFSLIEIYGTNVTGALGYRKKPGPYELFPHFRREGGKTLKRLGTGDLYKSQRLVWHRERSFAHWTQGSE